MRHPLVFLVSLILGGLLIAAPARVVADDAKPARDEPAMMLPGSMASMGMYVARTMMAKALTEQRHAAAPKPAPAAKPAVRADLLKRLLPWISTPAASDHETRTSSLRAP